MSLMFRLTRLLMNKSTNGVAVPKCQLWIKAPPPQHRNASPIKCMVRPFSDHIGSGSGKGGGGGGSIKEAGGAMGEMATAREEEFFRREQAKQIQNLKTAMRDMYHGNIQYHNHQIDRHLTGITEHEKMIKDGADSGLHRLHIEQHKESINHHRERLDHYHRQIKLMHLDDE